MRLVCPTQTCIDLHLYSASMNFSVKYLDRSPVLAWKRAGRRPDAKNAPEADMLSKAGPSTSITAGHQYRLIQHLGRWEKLLQLVRDRQQFGFLLTSCISTLAFPTWNRNTA